MAGLYIHIPFCKSRCVYCGFYSTTLLHDAWRYVGAVCKEIMLRKDYLDSPPETVYLGGGTPSLLSAAMLSKIFGCIDTCRAKEITIECNPDDITEEYAGTLSTLPINRVSLGVQTFCDSRLRFLRRRHTSAEVKKAVETLRAKGFGNISIDLMYGFPGETAEEWAEDIRQAVALEPEHISAYCLSFEEGTALHSMLLNGMIKEIDEETCLEMYETLTDRLSAAGFEHYEISNFARCGYRSRHNSGYWRSVPYLGIGAAAHSFNGDSRQWNVSDIIKYMDSIEQGRIPSETETLDTATKYDDTVMLSLRTCEGIDLNSITQKFGKEYADFCLSQAASYISNGLLQHSGNKLRLTRKGLFVSDMIMSDLMKV